MKEMSKSRYNPDTFIFPFVLTLTRVITKKSVNSVMNEKQLLSILKHPYPFSFAYQVLTSLLSFIVNMIYAFQDRENLYLVMDLMSGGDLRFHLARKRRFTEDQTSIVYGHSPV